MRWLIRFRFWLAGRVFPRVFYLPDGASVDIDALANGERVIYIPPNFPPPAIHKAVLELIVSSYRFLCVECDHHFTTLNAYQTHDCKLHQEWPIRLALPLMLLAFTACTNQRCYYPPARDVFMTRCLEHMPYRECDVNAAVQGMGVVCVPREDGPPSNASHYSQAN